MEEALDLLSDRILNNNNTFIFSLRIAFKSRNILLKNYFKKIIKFVLDCSLLLYLLDCNTRGLHCLK